MRFKINLQTSFHGWLKINFKLKKCSNKFNTFFSFFIYIRVTIEKFIAFQIKGTPSPFYYYIILFSYYIAIIIDAFESIFFRKWFVSKPSAQRKCLQILIMNQEKDRERESEIHGSKL